MLSGRLSLPGLNSCSLKHNKHKQSTQPAVHTLRLQQLSSQPATWHSARRAAPCRAQAEKDDGGESTESMFQKELQKRGLKFQDGQLVQKDGSPGENLKQAAAGRCTCCKVDLSQGLLQATVTHLVIAYNIHACSRSRRRETQLSQL